MSFLLIAKGGIVGERVELLHGNVGSAASWERRVGTGVAGGGGRRAETGP